LERAIGEIIIEQTRFLNAKIFLLIVLEEEETPAMRSACQVILVHYVRLAILKGRGTLG